MTTTASIRKVFHFPALLIGIGAVIAGTAAANLRGNAEVLPATLCFIFVIFAQLTGIALYLYYVLKKLHEEKKKDMNPDNREDREYVSKLAARELYYKAFTLGFGLMALMVGSSMVSMGGYMMLLIGIFIFVAIWFMTGGNYPILDTPWSPLFSFLMFGPVAVITTSLMQSQHETTEPLNWFDIAPAIYMSLAVGFMAAIATMTTNFARSEYDRGAHNDTFLISFGRDTTLNMIMVCAVLSAATLIFSSYRLNFVHPLLGYLPAVIPFVVNLWILYALRTLPHDPDQAKRNLKIIETVSYANVTLMGVIAFIVSFCDGVPDDSRLHFFN